MKEITCAVVQDLLPMYAEDLTSEQTARMVKSHLENCGQCRAFYENCQKELPVPIEKPAGKDRKIVRRMRFQLLWYLFWPALYAVGVQFQFKEIWQIMIVALVGVWAVTNTHVAEYVYDLDDSKKAFYERERRNMQEGKGSFFVQGFTWMLPILLPVLLGLIPFMREYINYWK